MNLPVERFVDLAPFAHAALLRASESCWGALGQSLKDYVRAHVTGRVRTTVPDTAHIGRDVDLGEGTIVEPGAFIEGPTIIGRNCHIRHTAYIRGNVVIGDDCVVGHATEVKGSIFLDGAKAAHFAYVGDSILGNRVNLGAGAKLANFRFDGKEIRVSLGDDRVATGTRKLGAVVGDEVQIGCNAVTSPGCFLEPGVYVFPCVCVPPGLHEAGARIA